MTSSLIVGFYLRRRQAPECVLPIIVISRLIEQSGSPTIVSMITHESKIEPQAVYGDGIQDVRKQILVGPRNGFPGYLREFTLAAGGRTPYHQHDWYHVVYVLGGSGTARYLEEEHLIRTGSVIFVEAGKTHCFIAGGEGLIFLCLVPEKGDQYAEED